jgi:hypothetical protein
VPKGWGPKNRERFRPLRSSPILDRDERKIDRSSGLLIGRESFNCSRGVCLDLAMAAPRCDRSLRRGFLSRRGRRSGRPPWPDWRRRGMTGGIDGISRFDDRVTGAGAPYRPGAGARSKKSQATPHQVPGHVRHHVPEHRPPARPLDSSDRRVVRPVLWVIAAVVFLGFGLRWIFI